MHSGDDVGGKLDVYRKWRRAWMVRYVWGRYRHLGLLFGGKVRGVGAVLIVAGSTPGESVPPEIEVAAVLGALPVELFADIMVVAMDMVLSMVLLLPGVIVTPELLIELPGAVMDDPAPDLNVAASLPS